MMAQTPRHPRLAATAALCVLLVFASAAGASEGHHNSTALAYSSSNVSSSSSTSANNTNFGCPADCQCVLAHNTHKPLLHAKCTSIADLRSDAPLRASLPIHSVDLSYLGLSRLSHTLEKLRDLTSVDLSHNELHEIGHLGRRIKKLNLKHNRLTSSKLTKLPHYVQVLNLQHNDITYLPLEFTRLTQLQSLELSHNEINCSCETLEVRNWLQARHVFMEQPVKCASPPEVKGKPWLQVKQGDICDRERRGWYADAATDENELMLADQPIEEPRTRDGDGDGDEDEDELGKAFLPLDQKAARSVDSKHTASDVEGSGDLDELKLPLEQASTAEPALLMARMSAESTTALAEQADEDEDGSGSGGGILVIPHLAREPLIHDDFDQPDLREPQNADDDFGAPKQAPSADIFGNGMGIFDDGGKTEGPVTEQEIVAVVQHNELAAPPGGEERPDVFTDSPVEAVEAVEGLTAGPSVMQAEVGAKDDSKATYFLLGVVVLIVVGLIFYVGIKRCKNRSSSLDIESPRSTELLEMDKTNLGKPVQRNGHATEQAPLIGEKTKADLAKPVNGAGKKPYDANDVKDGPSAQQPLLTGNGAPTTNSNGNVPAEPSNNALEVPLSVDALSTAPHEYHPITSRYPPPKSPRGSKYGQLEPNNNNEDVVLGSSPKSGRYSPVYSPETGRVKIKLTETPRPKTPMLVTRSKSNAGDIITTPVRAAHLNLAAPEVAAGGANGHLDH